MGFKLPLYYNVNAPHFKPLPPFSREKGHKIDLTTDNGREVNENGYLMMSRVNGGL